jgi:hypothetical protein
MHFSDEVRLACQTHVEGDGVKLTRIIRDESDIDLYVTTAASFRPRDKQARGRCADTLQTKSFLIIRKKDGEF